MAYRLASNPKFQAPNPKKIPNSNVQMTKTIHDDISLIRFVIPGSTEPALACPVLDTGYLIRGNPLFLKYWFPAFAGTASGFLLEFIPYLIRGRNDGLCYD